MSEAVACYRAGAYRSAIIMGWIAVVFDFVHKLRELEMTGDKQAKKKLEEFDSARKAHDTSQSLTFEKSVVTSMRDEFELISPIESMDFQRLFDDRNRCAHPSMVSSDDAFQPTAELARTHIVVAITSLLQMPPVQGKAALDRIWSDIKSEYFPADAEKAGEFLRNGPLQRARPGLVRSVVIGITKDIFHEGRKNSERLRQYAALQAILKLYHEPSSAILKEKLPALAAGSHDAQFDKVIRFLAVVPGAWEWAGEATRIRAQEFVRNGPADKLTKYVPYCLRSQHLRGLALARLESADDEQTLQKLIRVGADVVYVDHVIRLLGASAAFRTAEDRLQQLVIPLAPVLSAEHLGQIAQLFANNDQITWAAGTADLLLDLFRRTSNVRAEARAHWEQVFEVLSTHPYYQEPSRGAELRSALNKEFKFVEDVAEEEEPQELS
jgi:hypothetical protein